MLATLLLLPLTNLGPGTAVRAAEAPAWPTSASRVVVVAAPGLMWEDLTPTLTPAMWSLAETGSVGLLSVRAVPWVSCPADGWLTLSAGGRAQAQPPPPGGCPTELPYLTPVPNASGGTTVPEMPLIREDNEATLDRAHPGLLGDGVRCAAAVGRGATLGTADSQGQVALYREGVGPDLADVLDRCPLSIVAAEQLQSEPRVRTQGVRAIDDVVAEVVAGLPDDAVLFVVGISETGRRPRAHLQVAIASGAGLDGGWLTSSSTRRDRYVQLIDLAPSALALLGEETQDATGRPMSVGSPRERDFAEEQAWLVAASHRARLQQNLMGPFDVVWGITGVLALVTLAVAGRLVARRGSDAGKRRVTMAAIVVGAAYAAVPVSSFLANVVPWWKAVWPAPLLAGLIVAWVAVIVTVALAVPWRSVEAASRGTQSGGLRLLAPAALVAAVTVVVLGVDVLTGSSLEMDSMLGYSPLVAGRFTGLSNMAFAAYSVAGLFVLGVLAHGRSKAWGLVIFLVGGGLSVYVVASADAGNNFGGTLALIPALAVLAALVLVGRLTWKGVFAALGLAALTVLAFAYVDYLRPEDERSHFGGFVEDLLSGEAWEVVSRKAAALLSVVFATPVTFAVPFLLAALTVLLIRPRGRGSSRLAEALDAVPPLRAVMISAAVCTLLGFALNDSGVALAGTALGVAVPLALLGVSWARRSHEAAQAR